VDLFLFPALASIFFFLMKYWLKYDVKNIQKSRAFYKEITKDPRPLLICSNHLTYIDSILLIWIFGHPLWYLTHFKKASWNLPNAKYAKNFFFRVVGYVGKCIFVRRDGNFGKNEGVLDQTIYILNRKEVFTIFPEGKRSKTRRFDATKLVYGPGKIISEVKDCRVLCVYLRGDKQTAATRLPPKGSVFDLRSRFINPTTTKQGYDGYRDVVYQIGQTIKALEVEHFSL
jgi:1-acyl-sn-glycerol-3-phosphate acyltransferase